MTFLQLFRTLEGRNVAIELKNYITLQGILQSEVKSTGLRQRLEHNNADPLKKAKRISHGATVGNEIFLKIIAVGICITRLRNLGSDGNPAISVSV
jgi:hypothetical protein